jgi:hypothetical protein
MQLRTEINVETLHELEAMSRRMRAGIKAKAVQQNIRVCHFYFGHTGYIAVQNSYDFISLSKYLDILINHR